MITEGLKNIEKSKKELRKFGLTTAAGLSILGAVFFIRGKNYCLYLFILSSLFFFFSLAAPIILKSAQKLFMILSALVGWVISRLVLIALFYLIFTPLGLLGRLLGKEFLDLNFKNKKDSYWIKKEVKRFDKKNCQHQF